MPFAASPSILGVPDFNKIHIDPEETAKAFQAYLNNASKLTGVSLDDISRRVVSLPPSPQNVTLTSLLAVGMKLFDAVVWLSAGRPGSHPLMVDPTMTMETIPSLEEISRSLFYCYFFLLTQARYPVSGSTGSKPTVSNFLRTIMGMTQDQSHYVDMLCSFPAQKFDPKWIRYVNFDNFGQETLSRFGLGVAGYRMARPFALYQPRADLDAGLTSAVAFGRSLATAPATWDIHPVTRSPNVLTSRGNLNKNFGNLILAAFTDAQIDEMVNSKILYAKPTHDPVHKNFLTWSAVDDISGTATIFRNA